MNDLFLYRDSDEYAVIIEKMRKGDWWVELVNKKTGMTRTMFTKTKKTAFGMFKGMSLHDIIMTFTRLRIPAHKVYDSGVTFNHLKD